ncbi:acyl-CoA dehydrogenase family protein [Imbroritus primus]|uniref:acyl-CoA dehydrogenase family protein n=1 Tax=Imbroritus primus TaxID=3058603 RepID=UPI003D161984
MHADSQASVSHVDEESFAQMMDAIERFVREDLIPREQEVEDTDRVPDEIIEAMKAQGFFGLSIAPEFGGSGLSAEQQARFQMAISLSSPAFRYVYSSNLGIGSRAISLDGTPEQKAEFLPRLASGELIGAFALTEPSAGSDAGSLKTRADRDGDHYVLNGTKRFITNAPRADVFTVMARTDQSKPGASGVSAFIVDRNTPGLTVGKPEKKMGHRGSQIADVIFENVRVPAERLIGGEEGRGFRTAMKTLDHGRINIAAMGVGMAQRLLDEAVAYAGERQQFGKAIIDFQLIQGMLADSETEIQAARAMTLAAARQLDLTRTAVKEAAAAKYFASEMLCRVADRVVQVFGGAGYVADYPIERMYRDARLLRLYEGTSQILQIVIARAIGSERGIRVA